MASKRNGPNPVFVVGGVAALTGFGAWLLFRDRTPSAPTLPTIVTPPPPGTCVCVLGTLENRCRAIQELLRLDEVAHVAQHLLSLGGDFVARAAHYVANAISYEADPPECDRWCSPARTLSTRRGDCDDFAILLASVLMAAGVPALVVIGRIHGNASERHAWVEGADGQRLFFVEPQRGEVLLQRPFAYVAEQLLGIGFCQPCTVA